MDTVGVCDVDDDAEDGPEADDEAEEEVGARSSLVSSTMQGRVRRPPPLARDCTVLAEAEAAAVVAAADAAELACRSLMCCSKASSLSVLWQMSHTTSTRSSCMGEWPNTAMSCRGSFMTSSPALAAADDADEEAADEGDGLRERLDARLVDDEDGSLLAMPPPAPASSLTSQARQLLPCREAMAGGWAKCVGQF